MKNLFLALTFPAALLTWGLQAADPAPIKGFRFPGGEAETGREAFLKLNCVHCHAVSKVKFPELKTPRVLEVTLGKELSFAKKYEDIITAITNPRHVLTEKYRALLDKDELQGGIEPLMPDVTRAMSARQLMDIVTFLDEVYRKELPAYGK